MYNLEFQFVWTSIIITGISLSICDLEKVEGTELKRLKYFNRAAKNSNRAVTVYSIYNFQVSLSTKSFHAGLITIFPSVTSNQSNSLAP